MLKEIMWYLEKGRFTGIFKAFILKLEITLQIK
jgi:hypothetical protein